MKNASRDTTKTAKMMETNPVVQKAIEAIKQTLTNASKKDFTSKYAVGEKVNEVVRSAANEKYGKYAVATIAKAVDLTPSRLYQFAEVARAFERADFNEFFHRAANARLTFSHLHELAHADHEAHRRDLLDEAIEKKMKLRELRARRGAGKKPSLLSRIAAEGPTDEVRKEVEAKVQELLQQADELTRRLAEVTAAGAAEGEPTAVDESGADLGKAAE